VAVYSAVRRQSSNQLRVLVFSAGQRANSQLRLAVILGTRPPPLNPAAGVCWEHPTYHHEYWWGFVRRWYDDWTEYKWRGLFGGSQAKPAAGGLFGITATNPTDTNNLFGGGQQQQSNLFGTTTNTNPLPGGKNFFGSSALGTSTFGSGQQPQQQQLTAGSLLSSRSAGGLGQQQNDPASQHVLGLKGYMMRGTLLPLSVGFR
jgi:hypothetical protein